MRRFPIWLLISICGLILATGLSIYFYRFHSGLSEQQSVYGTFGDYLNPFLTFISIVLLSYISIRANQISETYNQIQLQPHLYLTMGKSAIVPNDEDWVICNGYDAPGINILVRMTFDRASNNYTRWINCFSLGSNLKKSLVWVRWPDEIQIMCSDISGTRFFSIVYRDWTATINGDVDAQLYRDALQIARSHTLNTNDLVSRDFQSHFFGTAANSLTRNNYEQYLRSRGLL